MANKTKSILPHKTNVVSKTLFFTPKYKRKLIYSQLKTDIKDILKQSCGYKEV